MKGQNNHSSILSAKGLNSITLIYLGNDHHLSRHNPCFFNRDPSMYDEHKHLSIIRVACVPYSPYNHKLLYKNDNVYKNLEYCVNMVFSLIINIASCQ